jgi:hypothetical protein
MSARLMRRPIVAPMAGGVSMNSSLTPARRIDRPHQALRTRGSELRRFAGARFSPVRAGALRIRVDDTDRAGAHFLRLNCKMHRERCFARPPFCDAIATISKWNSYTIQLVAELSV